MSRRTLVAVTVLVAVLGFTLVTVFYNYTAKQQAAIAVRTELLVRPHAPVFGPRNAPVTIVEFFDPACGTCRAFHPVVKQIMRQYPNKVRVVMRYATFHQGSDQVVRILEAARLQGKLEPVLEAVLEAQPKWSPHGGGAPNLGNAWQAASSAGMDVAKGRREIMKPEITEILNQDAADVSALGVNKTPTFYVNGRPLPSFGIDQLFALVREEVEAVGG
ncbi:MAG: thioredoxin domain-containing protein [Alphaproteobacteria bacterium]|nr:thioredoxin domain-containing protein [Alphaproteobacteria bacterium]